MFTMPAIHHSSVRTDDGCMGTMPLNALNGSSDAIGSSDSNSRSNNDQNGVFGSYFGASLKDSHPYRRQDSGLSFLEASEASAFSLISTSSTCKPTLNRRDSYTFFGASETANPGGQRRRSLDLNEIPDCNQHPRYKGRSFSVGELGIDPHYWRGRFINDTIDETEQVSGLNVAALSLTEVNIKSSKSQAMDKKSPTSDSASKTSQTNHKKKKAHSSEGVTSIKNAKLLEKIKDNINNNSKHSRHRNENSQTEQDSQITSSKSGSSRHNKSRHQSDPATQKHEHSHKDKKLAVRANAN